MMRIYLLAICCLLGLRLDAQVLEDLHYCNENVAIRSITIMPNGYVIGTSLDHKTLYLINKNNVLKDTLVAGSSPNNLIHAIQPIDTNTFFVNLFNKMIIARIVKDEIVIILEKQAKDFPFFVNYILNDSLAIGWSRRKGKKGKIWPYNFVIWLNNKVLFESDQDLTVQSKYDGSGQMMGEGYLDYTGGNFYFPIEACSKIFIFNIYTHKHRYVSLPPIVNKGESWYYYFDLKARQHYGVLFRKSASNKMYEIKKDFTKMTLINEFNYRPYGINDGRVQQVINFEEDKLICHYMHPLYPTNEQYIQLEEITISIN